MELIFSVDTATLCHVFVPSKVKMKTKILVNWVHFTKKEKYVIVPNTDGKRALP